ncbi:MAG: hypothetical protein KJO83_06755 [Bacteroidia bacterium]|nr:hypothetical protein [Bacteroidia bacterium]
MKNFLKLIFVLLAAVVGIYLGLEGSVALIENDHVNLGNPAGNLLYPLFILVCSLSLGALFGVVAGVFIAFSAKKILKSPQK